MKLFTPERLYSFVMFLISLVLAGFLTGLGSIIIGDLPRVENRVELQDFVDQDAQRTSDLAIADLRTRQSKLQSQLPLARNSTEDARRAYQIASDAFRSWAATRSTTGDDSQNEELTRRSQQLDDLRTKLAKQQDELAGIQAEIGKVSREQTRLNEAYQKRLAEARPAFKQAQFVQTARVFAFRLAFTLPLILISIWFIRTKRQSRYWPLYRGFILFSLFAFFVELVPYLPSYGGYIRYVVGIGLTLLAGHYLVRWMRGYLEERQRERQISEKERRQALDYDAAVNKAGKGICPGCERSIETVDEVKSDYCAHCGLMLYENCGNCTTRKLVFHHYCLKCGVETHEKTTAT